MSETMLGAPLPLRTAPRKVLRAVRFVAFDFDGVFTDDAVYVGGDGVELVRCWRGDGVGLRKLEQLAIGLTILSAETNPVVAARARKLRIPCVQGAEEKHALLMAHAAALGLAAKDIAYVGNDVNDVACLRSVGLSITVPNAQREALLSATYVTDACGGHGAVREVCEAVAAAYQPGQRSRRPRGAAARAARRRSIR